MRIGPPRATVWLSCSPPSSRSAPVRWWRCEVPRHRRHPELAVLTSAAPPFILTRLSVLFFLQFFIWGAWYLTGFRYMIAHEMSHNAFWLYTASPLGAIFAPF